LGARAFKRSLFSAEVGVDSPNQTFYFCDAFMDPLPRNKVLEREGSDESDVVSPRTKTSTKASSGGLVNNPKRRSERQKKRKPQNDASKSRDKERDKEPGKSQARITTPAGATARPLKHSGHSKTASISTNNNSHNSDEDVVEVTAAILDNRDVISHSTGAPTIPHYLS
jgi:hypothetical protein